MRTALLVLLLGLLAPLARADVLQLPEPAAALPELPVRGQTMQQVQQRLGPPVQRYAPVGGGHPKRPPITRWDYDGYSVFFEHDRVIDAVVKGQPKPLRNVDQLQAGTP
jgi:hypothetical protein